jgi:hypothetical protein
MVFSLAPLARYTKGCLMAIDNIPPFILPFPVKPETIDDDWSAEFSHVTSPGSRFQYPIFSGVSPRVISFRLRFDADYAGISPDVGMQGNDRNCDDYFTPTSKRGHFKDEFIYTQEMQSVIAVLESLKLPKQGIATVIADVAGLFSRVQKGASDPAPPLCLVMFSPVKIMVGHFSEIKINVTRRTEYMLPSRIEADCKFLVTPDYIFTTVEDIYRFAMGINSIAQLFRRELR